MYISKKIITLLAGAALVTAMLSGCSVGTKQAAAGTASQVRTVKVAAKNAEPYQFMNKDNQFDGYNADVLKAVNEKLKGKYKFEFSTVDANAVFVGLQAGKYDMAVGNYYTSEERNKSYYHSNEMTFISDLRLIVRADDDSIQNLDDIALKHKKLAQINVADPRYNVIQRYNEKHAANPVDLRESGFEATADVLKTVANGQNDAAMFPLDGYDAVEKVSKLPLKTVDTVVLIPVVYFYHMSDQDKELRDDIDTALKELRADGTLSNLSKKWFNGNDPFTVKGAAELKDVDFWKQK